MSDLYVHKRLSWAGVWWHIQLQHQRYKQMAEVMIAYLGTKESLLDLYYVEWQSNLSKAFKLGRFQGPMKYVPI